MFNPPPNPALFHPVYIKDDEADYSYVEFPQDVIFMEALAKYGNKVIVPCQREFDGKKTSHIYEFTPGQDATAKHVAGPLQSPDGSEAVTIFGVACTTTGILYCCAFNRNSVIVFDLNKLEGDGPAKAFMEIDNLPAPNDLAIDPKNQDIVYIAGGKFTWCLCASFSNAVAGHIYKVTVDVEKKSFVTDTAAAGLKTLAGIEVMGDEIWTAQLFNIVKQKENVDQEPTVEWEGYDCNQNVWLADNIDTFGDDMLICPAYSSVPAMTVDKVLKQGWVATAGGFVSQVLTACTHGENIADAIRDPEVDLAFSNTYVSGNAQPNPIRLIFLKPGDPDSTIHFEVDLVETRKGKGLQTIARGGKELGKRHYFNEQVTHAAHVHDEDGNGYVACVNFEQPRVLLLKDEKFKAAMAK